MKGKTGRKPPKNSVSDLWAVLNQIYRVECFRPKCPSGSATGYGLTPNCTGALSISFGRVRIVGWARLLRAHAALV